MHLTTLPMSFSRLARAWTSQLISDDYESNEVIGMENNETELFYSDPEGQQRIHWNDPAIGIDWPDAGSLLLSEKDQAAPLMDSATLFP